MARVAYLDHNATTPVRPEVARVMADALAVIGNPSSVHAYGRTARRWIEEARERAARLVGALPEQVVFTSGGTEANNLAIRGCGRERILVSAVEHDSVLGAVDGAERIPVDGDGVVDLDALERMLGGDGSGTLVCMMLANNETGAIQPLRNVVERAHGVGALVHCDAVQAAGKIAVDVTALGVDLLSLSAHKMGGPQGVGALVVGDGVPLTAFLRGGGQERRRRSGTENLPGITGFGRAAESAFHGFEAWSEIEELRDWLEREVRGTVPEARIFGERAPRLPTTTCLSMPGVPGETQVMALDLAGVAVSAGSACSSGKVAESHVLSAMGAGSDAGCAIRVSLGWTTRAEDVDRFLEAWVGLRDRLRARKRAAATAA